MTQRQLVAVSCLRWSTRCCPSSRPVSTQREGHMTQMAQSRRRFLAALTAAGGAGLIGATSSIGQEAPPEATTVRLSKIAGTCIAPQYLAEEFLRLEGFANVQYVMS